MTEPTQEEIIAGAKAFAEHEGKVWDEMVWQGQNDYARISSLILRAARSVSGNPKEPHNG